MTTPKRLVDEVSNVSSGSKKSKPIIRSSPGPKKTFVGKDLKNSAVIQPKAKQKISVFKKPSSIKSPTKRDFEAESSVHLSSKKFTPTSKIDIKTNKKQNKNLDVELEDSPEYQLEVQEPLKVKVELDSSPESGNKQESEIKE